MKRFLIIGSLLCGSLTALSQGAVFTTTDTAVQQAYRWAASMVQHYRGNPGDPVGPWYEAALPARNAFCMRDVAHQTIGAAICGLDKENRNMLRAFATHIAEKRDWCSYWEINKWALPAPEDYRNDREFWYNLNANFDLLFACWKLYRWTGDQSYIQHPVFTRFFDKTANEYIRRWVLQPDSLFTRPLHPNAPSPFNKQDYFHRCRGLASYVENVPDLKMGVDLVAAIYRGLSSLSAIQQLSGDVAKAARYESMARQYREKIDAHWWNSGDQRYYTWYNGAGQFGTGEGEMFLLWFDALKDITRSRQTMAHLLAGQWNVETTSYLPVICYQQGYWQEARQYLLQLSDPATLRREYPEVSFGVVEGIVRGLMGIEPDAPQGRITTLYRGRAADTAAVRELKVMNTMVTVTHTGKQTVFQYSGQQALQWRAAFAGKHDRILVQNVAMAASHQTDNNGQIISFVDVKAPAGKSIKAIIK
nr:trehalase family glycosidase [uncultured Chitinophaga sp.]